MTNVRYRHRCHGRRSHWRRLCRLPGHRRTPDADRTGASPDLSVVLATSMDDAPNAILVWIADAVIIVGGSWVTPSELALAKRHGDVRHLPERLRFHNADGERDPRHPPRTNRSQGIGRCRQPTRVNWLIAGLPSNPHLLCEASLCYSLCSRLDSTILTIGQAYRNPSRHHIVRQHVAYVDRHSDVVEVWHLPGWCRVAGRIKGCLRPVAVDGCGQSPCPHDGSGSAAVVARQ